ncbi:MerR family transcriptional regulator [Saccharothrix algeriensis]|uniref:DNA-binding transcriptional MerR regulator n=1 Tax=Saccharothrix algeriensis TaxID=173560 RepID=A0ABS2S1J7_9PSEU|nr:MerR family transcriptional regulator [Saccharothrix algeriensis]MBM7810099.1 DNA-binding transcriptional MerR regulator [Saccharothrix algeriensis]
MRWSAGAVARMLGVSPVTLRTWDRRYGLGPSNREEGRHRRYSEDDVARLRRMLELTGRGASPASAAAVVLGEAPPPRARSGGGPRALAVEPEEARGFARAAARLDQPLMGSLAASLIARDGVVRAWQDVLMPFLVALGERIRAQGSGVEVEHCATAAIVGALRTGGPPVSGRLPALLACAPEEQHSLPLDVLAAALAERDLAARNLGARVPARALLDAVSLLAPAVVVLWAHAPGYAALAPVADLVGRGQAVVLGGPGWEPVPAGARWAASLPEAVDLVLELNRF